MNLLMYLFLRMDLPKSAGLYCIGVTMHEPSLWLKEGSNKQTKKQTKQKLKFVNKSIFTIAFLAQ